MDYKAIKVYAAEEVCLEGQCSMFVNFSTPSFQMNSCNFYFEGKGEEEENTCLSGITTNGAERIIARNTGIKRKRIQKGEFIGTISTIREEENEDSDEEEWSIQRLEKEIRLDEKNLTEEERKKILKMMVEVRKALSKNNNCLLYTSDAADE